MSGSETKGLKGEMRKLTKSVGKAPHIIVNVMDKAKVSYENTGKEDQFVTLRNTGMDGPNQVEETIYYAIGPAGRDEVDGGSTGNGRPLFRYDEVGISLEPKMEIWTYAASRIDMQIGRWDGRVALPGLTAHAVREIMREMLPPPSVPGPAAMIAAPFEVTQNYTANGNAAQSQTIYGHLKRPLAGTPAAAVDEFPVYVYDSTKSVELTQFTGATKAEALDQKNADGTSKTKTGYWIDNTSWKAGTLPTIHFGDGTFGYKPANASNIRIKFYCEKRGTVNLGDMFSSDIASIDAAGTSTTDSTAFDVADQEEIMLELSGTCGAQCATTGNAKVYMVGSVDGTNYEDDENASTVIQATLSASGALRAATAVNVKGFKKIRITKIENNMGAGAGVRTITAVNVQITVWR